MLYPKRAQVSLVLVLLVTEARYISSSVLCVVSVECVGASDHHQSWPGCWCWPSSPHCLCPGHTWPLASAWSQLVPARPLSDIASDTGCPDVP